MFVFDGGEAGGVPEPAPAPAPVRACVWRRDRACLDGVDEARWSDGSDEARGW